MLKPRPLPGLQLPVAFLRYWPSSDPASSIDDRLSSLAIYGVETLGSSLLAVLPTDGRASVFDTATRLAQSLVLSNGKTSPGALIFPGRVLQQGQSYEAVHETLLDDLDQQPLEVPEGAIYLTGYASAWLRGSYTLKEAGLYSAPSGRRFPLFQLVGPHIRPQPWHNPEILKRRPWIPRPELEQALRDRVQEPMLRLTGALGTGKSAALWRHLEAVGKKTRIWVDLGRALPGSPMLASEMVAKLAEWAPDAAPQADLAALPSAASSGHLVGWLGAAGQATGEIVTLVCDLAQSADESDRQLLRDLIAHPEFQAVCQLRVVERFGGRTSDFEGLPELRVGPLTQDESLAFAEQLFQGLELKDRVQQRFIEAAAGHPFALEEGLLQLVHRGLLRQVYGSFFFAGESNIDYEPSERLVRHVEAEARRLGNPLPLRILTLAEEPITAAHLMLACDRFGLELEDDWYLPFVDAGWLRYERASECLGFVCPAYARALRLTVTSDGGRSLRHALGGVLAGDRGGGWHAYQLLAGSREAVDSLLEFSRDSSGSATREEIFNALWNEHREHRARFGDEATELEILWALLPLARRLGCLGQLQDELTRAVELARGDEQRYVALVALKAQFDQEKGRFREAEKGLREALSHSERFDDQRRAILFIRLGALLHREERWREARDIFHTLLSVIGEHSPVSATCFFYLGNIALHQRRLTASEQYHQKSLAIRQQKKLTKAEGISLSALGAVGLALGDFPKALERFRHAEKTLMRSGTDALEMSYAALGEGRALARLGNLAAAGPALRRALEARQARDDMVGEAIVRLELASLHLALEQQALALEETRRAHFHLSLIPEVALVGTAERLLGRILGLQGDTVEADNHLRQALRIHAKHEDLQALAEDRSVNIELAIQRCDREAIYLHAMELRRLLDNLRHPVAGETLFYQLYRGLEWLRQEDDRVEDSLPFLRLAYQELMRKTSYLPADQRHHFLYQIRVHLEISNAASERQLPLPVFTDS